MSVWIILTWIFGTIAVAGSIYLTLEGVRLWRLAKAVENADDYEPNGTAEVPPDKRKK